MIKSNGWLNTLVTLILIATPALIGFYLMFPDWRPTNSFSYYWYWITVIIFLMYAIFISWTFIKLKILAYDSIAFMLPVALVFAGLFVTANMSISSGADIAIRVLIGVIMMCSAWPFNVFVTNLKEKKIQEYRAKQKRNLRK